MRHARLFAFALLAVYVLTTTLLASSSTPPGISYAPHAHGDLARTHSTEQPQPSEATSSCVSCNGRQRTLPTRVPPRNPCSLSLETLLQMADHDPDQFVVIGDMVQTRTEPHMSCSGYELLAHVIYAAQRPSTKNSTRCALQKELLSVASQLAPSLSVGGSGSASVETKPEARFTLLQDCERPPCCSDLLVSFAEEHERAAVFAPSVSLRGMPPSRVPLNLYGLTTALDARSLLERRNMLRTCGGGCLTLQISHALQGHPLLDFLADVEERDAVASGAPLAHAKRRLLFDGRGASREDVAAVQEARAQEHLASSAAAAAASRPAGKHAALLRALGRELPTTATIGEHIVAVTDGRTVSGPAATVRARAGEGDTAPLPLALPSPSPPPSLARGTRSADERSSTPYMSSSASAAAAPASNALLGTHLSALGSTLRAARRTFLLLPAAEAIADALRDAKLKGLPPLIASLLQSLVPYKTARQAERWLVDAAGGEEAWKADGPLEFLRVAGSAQKAAHARGLLLLNVVHEPSDSHKRPYAACGASNVRCTEAANARGAGGLLLETAISLGLDDETSCRLRRRLARAPLRSSMMPDERWWRLIGSSVDGVDGISETLGLDDMLATEMARTDNAPRITGMPVMLRDALASYHAADRALFPRLCPAR